MTLITLPPPATAAGRATQRTKRSDDLLHAWFVDTPSRTLCGQPRDQRKAGEPYYEREAKPDDCLVCISLAEDYIDGRWHP